MVLAIFMSLLSIEAMSNERVRVLAIDGGGVRGIIPAVILEKIEEEMGRPIAQIFDMVAGSSTGGLLALGLTAPNQNQQPVASAKTAVQVYLLETPGIFTSSWKHKFKNLGGLLGPKYELTGLTTMTAQLGDAKLSEALIPTLVTGYHVAGESGIEFFSVDAKKYPAEKDCLMRQVAMATAAAPVYFDSVDVDFAWEGLWQ